MNKQYINKIIVFVGPVLALLLLVITANAQSTWTTKANFSCTPRNGAAFFVIGTKAYVGTGEDADSLRSDFWQWDICSNTWTQISNFPGAPRTSGNGFTIGTNGYVGFGWDNRVHGTIFYNDIYEYTPSSNTWTAKAPFNGGGREQASCININDSIYIGLGYSGFSLNDFWKYDAVNDTWIQKGNFPGSNRRDAASFAINGKGYIGTGYDESTGSVNDFWEYNPDVDQWTQMADYGGVARHLGVGFAIGNIGYIGLGTGNGGLVNDFWSYNPATDNWTQQADFGGSPRDVAVGFSVGCRGYVGLGGNYPTPPSAIDFWEFYDPVNPYPCFASPVNAGPDTTICGGQSTTLHGTGGNVAGYTWSPAIGLSSTSIANPVASPTITTPYVLEATGGSGCSITTYVDVVIVNVTPGITLNLTNDTTVCDGQPVALNPNGSTLFNYSWIPNIALSCDTCANPIATPETSVTYTLTVSSGSCTVIDSVQINLGGKAVGGRVTALRDTICAGTPGNLSLSGNSSDSIQWQGSLNNNTYAGISGATSATYKTLPLQRSTWYHAVVGTGHCTATSDSLQLIVPPALIASFYSTQTAGKQLNFNSDSSIGAIRSYHWDFGDGQSSTGQNPSHTFAKDSTYYVCLTLYDGSNCSYTYCRYSSITDGVPTISAGGNWIIYPNPFSEQLTISSKQLNASVESIEMYDVLGQLVINKNLAGTTNTNLQLDVSSLAKGMYFVMIRTTNADYVQKVVKE